MTIVQITRNREERRPGNHELPFNTGKGFRVATLLGIIVFNGTYQLSRTFRSWCNGAHEILRVSNHAENNWDTWRGGKNRVALTIWRRAKNQLLFRWEFLRCPSPCRYWRRTEPLRCWWKAMRPRVLHPDRCGVQIRAQYALGRIPDCRLRTALEWMILDLYMC